MAYIIRYGPSSRYGRVSAMAWKTQLFCSGALLLGMLAGNQFDQGRAWMQEVFGMEQPSALEAATAVFAQDITRGIWWVDGLADFCRTLLSYG